MIDDGSIDATAAVAANLVGPENVVRIPENRGLPAARNVGAAAARAGWLLYCDDDVVLSAHVISELWTRRLSGTCLVPVVVGPNGQIQNSVTLEWKWGDPKFRFHAEPVAEPAFPMGSCFLVSYTDYERAGGCDERFVPMYYDDAALGARLRRGGTKVAMISDVVVTHLEHGDEPSAARRSLIQRWVYRNRWTYVLFALRGRQRAIAISLGIPRVAVESVSKRSMQPIFGYWRALRKVPCDIRAGSNGCVFESSRSNQTDTR